MNYFKNEQILPQKYTIKSTSKLLYISVVQKTEDFPPIKLNIEQKIGLILKINKYCLEKRLF